MRKCPNCKKPVSVGARRCVHCRTLLTDANETDNSPREDEYDDRDAEDSPRIKGIGSMSSSEMRRRWDEPLDNSGGQATISGMPGISFDFGGGFRPSSAVLNASRLKEPEQPKPESDDESTPGILSLDDLDKAGEEFATLASSSGVVDAVAPAQQGQSVSALAGLPGVSAPAPAQPQSVSVLAGLPGVSTSPAAPVPSSLMDEELVDLTSKLFGDDYAAGTNIDDDEEDGWDFDFPAAPVAPKPAAPQPAPKIEAQPKQPEPAPKPVVPVAKPAANPISQPVVKTSSPAADPIAQPVAQSSKHPQAHAVSTTPLEQPQEGEAKVGTDKKSEHKHIEPVAVPQNEITQTSNNVAARVFAVLSAIAFIVWIVLLNKENGFDADNGAVMAAAAGVCVFIDFLFVGLSKKFSANIWTLILFLPAIVLMIMMFIFATGKIFFEVLLGALIMQFICAAIMFLKKS